MTADELFAQMQINTWGMELEGGTTAGGMTREQAATLVYEAFREEWPAEYPRLTLSPPVREQGDAYILRTSDPLGIFPELKIGFVHDGSIPYPNDIEINSPVYVWRPEHWSHWSLIVTTLRNHGFKVGTTGAAKRCGIHVHIGSRAFTGQHVRNLVYMVWSWENYITRALKPSEARYGYMLGLHQRRGVYRDIETVGSALVGAIKKLERHIRGRDIADSELADIWYSVYPGGRRDDKYHQSRYHGLNLHSHWFRHTIEFRWFDATTDRRLQKADVQLCYALVLNAVAATRMKADRKTVDESSAKYDFRVFLLRLGLIGDRFSTCRKYLLLNLPGSAAWKHGEGVTP